MNFTSLGTSFCASLPKVLCGYCKREDPEEKDGAETVQWIQCDACDNWFHQVCALNPLDDDDMF